MRQSRKWRHFFVGVGLPESLIQEYCAYVEALDAKGLPVIFEFRHLARLLGKRPAYVASAVHGTEKHYRAFEIPKRRGGVREIHAPMPALLECQQWINREILSQLPTHPAAHGFLSGRSIKTNAETHVGCNMLLKMDLKDFFPSISIRRVIAVFQRCGYPLNVAYNLARLCCLRDRLPQGSAASPSLSNLVTVRLDARLYALAKRFKLRYTRYADDMTFSGEFLSAAFQPIVGEIVKDEGFAINEQKTQTVRRGGQMIITGLSISDGKVRLPREMRRNLKQAVHYISRYGLTSHKSKMRIRDPFFSYRLMGKLVFWHWVEPKDAIAIKGLALMREQMRFFDR